jgi:polyhydroxybutyrate depolymerase
LGAVVQGVQDVEFVAAMLSDLKEQFNVDPRRIYATGFSNGASMAFRLARELSTVVAAVAPVAGGDWLENGKPDRAVPLMYVTGTADPLNPLEGGEIHIGPKYFGTKPPTDEMIGKWVKLHGCPEEPQTVRYENGVRRVAYGRSGEQNVVVLYMVDGHGHHWPGGRSRLPERLVGENTSKLKATDAIWEFFKEHSLAVVPGSSR